MRKTLALASAALIACALVAVSGANSATADTGSRTVTVGAFTVEWSATNPEEIVSLSWNGSRNLTNAWAQPFCPEGGDHEFFGNSWDTFNDVRFRALVGWGSTGTWDAQGPSGVRVDSATSSCFGTSGVPVETSYQFFDKGAPANRILVRRKFSFGTTPFTFDLRPYIPRLYPRSSYTQVIHPDSAGTSLVTEIGDSCEFGCEISNWDGTWFAEHDPVTGNGMIVRHGSSSYGTALWVDVDGGSFTTASSVALLQPEGGFTGTVTDVQFLCFYGPSIWTPSVKLPPGC
jgi:hypothetical protein